MVKKKTITNTELLKSINRSFSKVEEKIDAVDIKVEGLKGQIDGVNKRIDDFVVTRVKYEDHNKLKARVDIVEVKVGIKNS
ncbi:hypothetical protein A2647_01705 [Candidatus Nomurabacteria bacterium RIFCSPHIGHO2_01_FULL_40_24b]|uniref:Uncharacterized protein n=1 Tax=Candidatus Nomurabacteria bacterium RIFCSPHIGHO2_01_FULL_40_24b TaxID=1801739 RepID=A0A1F6V7E8_9BACT|nr:MAG: hypothetical protein A2647_01705 [Candidatus Nomurabacteria bacterium RIFCSPHIGHO2_01_FULL_40_24b]